MKRNSKKQIVTVIGGGSSAYSVISFLSGAGHTVNLLTRKPDAWNKKIKLHYQTPEGEIIQEFEGYINKISNNPSYVIPESSIIILCMPVAKYRIALHNIAPFISKDNKTFIGTVYGQAGFNWMVDEIKSKFSLNNIVTFAAGLIPWICRTKEYGKIGINYGSKTANVVAINPPEEFENLNEIILDDLCNKWFQKGQFVQAMNFISLTLSVDNQIIHTSRLYGMYLKYGGVWKKKEDVPYFYKDYDQLSADLLRDLDNDYSLIRNAIINKFPDKNFTYMMDYLTLERFSYSSSSENILESFINSVTLRAITTPSVQIESGEWVLDKNFRFFTDDIFYGNCIAKWIAEKLSLKVPTIDKILEWAQKLLDVKIIKDGKLLTNSEHLSAEFASGIPSVYGFSKIEELID